MKKVTYLLCLFLSGAILLSACTEDTEKKKLEETLNRQKAELDSLRTSGKPAESLADKFEHVHNSVVMIVAEGDMERSQGSAVVINASGDAISNFHVFQNSKRAYAVDSKGNQFPVTQIYRFSEEDDYIFFKIGNGGHIFQPATFAAQLPKVGATVFAIGNPRGLEQTLSDGIISAFRENNKLIQNTANITHGSSGGPLFNETGEVIGITTQGFLEDNLFFAINIQKLPLEDYKTGYQLDKPAETESSDDEQAVNVIKRYLLAEERRNFNDIYAYFAPGMQRYWDLNNPTRDQLTARYQHAWSISENSVNDLKYIKKISDYEFVYIVDFTYFSIKDQMYKTVTNSKVKVVFDSNYRIVSIYGV